MHPVFLKRKAPACASLLRTRLQPVLAAMLPPRRAERQLESGLYGENDTSNIRTFCNNGPYMCRCRVFREEATAAVSSCVAVQSILSAARDLQPAPARSLTWQRRLANAELYSTVNALTPYGTVAKETVVVSKSGPLTVYHVNPFALRAETSVRFRTFLAHVFDMGVAALGPFIVCFDLLRIMLVIFQMGQLN